MPRGTLTKATSRLAHPDLVPNSFSLELELNRKIFAVTRGLDNPKFVILSGDIKNLPLPEKPTQDMVRLSVSEWNLSLTRE